MFNQLTYRCLGFLTAVTAVALLLAGCSGEPTTESTTAATPPAVEVPAEKSLGDYLLATAPTGAIPVGEARQTAQPGAEIVVAGQIGGTMQPFGASFATLVLGDEIIAFCNETGADHCATPWDACCEDPEVIQSNRASVQLVANGLPLPGTLRGVGGLTELDHVIVTGTVDPTSTPDNLLINATGIYRVPTQG